jgi:TonB-dependent SusC/RagA subfamily outer membrane receptor
MKKSIMILTCLVVGMLTAIMLPAQTQKVTFTRSQMRISEAFSQIEKQTGLTIAYNEGILDVSRAARTVSGRTVKDALSVILQGTGTEPSFRGKMILIIRSSATPSARRDTLRGRITDANGEPLSGASVMIQGTRTGTTADFSGNFSFDNISFPATLEIAFLGFDTKVVHLNGNERMPYVIEMSESRNYLSDVVVVGYGTQKKVNLTGAVATVSSEDIKDRPVANVGSALQGLIPNLNITQSSGRPGAGSSYNIRGNTSPNGGSPLILVDGVDTYLERINSNDIETITVLKDAASAAIYGARAAYGVILVTTKGGKFNQARRSILRGDILSLPIPSPLILRPGAIIQLTSPISS